MTSLDAEALKEALSEVAKILSGDSYKLLLQPAKLRRVIRGLYVAVALLAKEHGVVVEKWTKKDEP